MKFKLGTVLIALISFSSYASPQEENTVSPRKHRQIDSAKEPSEDLKKEMEKLSKQISKEIARTVSLRGKK
ncbi:MAG: hypothetical protein WCG05_00140 [Alphaproteobacteria bacterium]